MKFYTKSIKAGKYDILWNSKSKIQNGGLYRPTWCNKTL